MLSDVVVPLLAVLAGGVKFLQSAVDFVQSRHRRDVPQGGVHVREVITEQPAVPTDAVRRLSRRVAVGLLLGGILVVAYGIAIAEDTVDVDQPRELEVLLGALMALEGVLLGWAALHALRRLRGSVSDQPLHSSAARVELSGTLAECQARCVEALLASDALRASGTGVRSEASTTRVWGGTNGWPAQARGCRLELAVTRLDAQYCSVAVRSETYRPSLGDRWNNDRNVRTVLTYLVSH